MTLPILLFAAIQFVHPKVPIILTMRQAEFHFQVMMERDARARGIEMRWDGVGCAGSHYWSLDGDNASRVQPQYKPLKVTASHGECELMARVFDAEGKVIQRGTLTVKVCGSGDECQ